jgi:hypothetical protein
LLKHKFFLQADKPEYIQREILYELPPLNQRFKVLEDRRKTKEQAQLKQLSEKTAERRRSVSIPSNKISLDMDGTNPPSPK